MPLRITVELIPHGVLEPKRIGLMIIRNRGGSMEDNIGHYEVDGTEDDHLLPMGDIRNHNRNNSVWALVAKAAKLLAAGSDHEVKMGHIRREF